MTPHRTGALACAILATITLPIAAPGLGATTSPAASPDAVSMAFAATAANAQTSSVVSLTNDGGAQTVQQVIRSGGGDVRTGAAADSDSGAIAFPDYTNGKASAPRAVVAVTNAGTTDELSPGGGDFAFGADVYLNAANHGGPGDNGNNVIQRGLFGSGAQLKLEFDKSKARCRIEGSAGNLSVFVLVPTQAWYRLACSVTVSGSGTDTLTITASPIAATGVPGAADSAVATGTVGVLSYPLRTPVSIGGKLNNNLTLQSSADQFNGRVDNAWLHLG